MYLGGGNLSNRYDQHPDHDLLRLMMTITEYWALIVFFLWPESRLAVTPHLPGLLMSPRHGSTSLWGSDWHD